MADHTWITRTDRGEGIVELVLNHAPVNALEPATLMGFHNVMNDLSADDDVRVIILSSGCKVFSAGLNLKQAQHFDLDGQRAIVDALNDGFMALFECPTQNSVWPRCGWAWISRLGRSGSRRRCWMRT